MNAPASTPALDALLAELPAIVPLERVDRVWVFPPRAVGEVESGLVVLALLAEGEHDQREVVTVQYEVRSGTGAPPPVREVTRRGWAPAERVPVMIAGVVRRLGGEEEEPRSAAIGGDPERWNRFTGAGSEGKVDPTNGE